MRSLFKRLLAASLLAGSMVSASAVSYSGITFFGDSLSDTGNIFAATSGALPTAPYFSGRFSEGAVWTDYLAGSLGYTATASLMGGQNYAFGGARTGSDSNPPGLLAQTAGLWAPTVAGAADPDRLYVLVGGGNDMRDARTLFQGNTVADEAGRQAAAELAAFQLTQSLGVLAGNGAKTVLIGNLPDLGRTPEAVALGLVAPSTDATNRFNALLPNVLAAGESFGLDMRFVDLAGVANSVFVDATANGGATFGITNVSTPCGTFQGSVGIACWKSAFSDALHPTTRVHQLFADAALQAALAPVPEPETYALLALGLAVVGWRARRRAA
jgi:outer membrane lipase/esterase